MHLCHTICRWSLPTIAGAVLVSAAFAGDATEHRGDASLGYDHLINTAYVPASLDQQVFDNLWKTWEEPLRSQAEAATSERRREMTLSRYGLQEAPGREGGIPLQYADDGKGGWATNCFTCHGGKIRGEVIPGLPNTHIALETLTKEVFETKKMLGREVDPLEARALFVPLGGSNGTTNAIIFGVLLGAYRDKDLNVDMSRPLPKLVHNDHDAPPWWHYKRKKFLYADGFAGKGHRALMQFMMAPSNGPEAFHAAEDDFKDIAAWIESIEAPKWPFDVDEQLAAEGHRVFDHVCAECHGTYGENGEWPGLIVPLEDVGTDRARLDSLTPEMRASYELSWFSNYGEKKAIADPGGYVAQPLDGIWASAPYLHNGSVPTIYHLFYPEKRPVVWRQVEDGYNQQKIGLEVVAYDELPASVTDPRQKRTYFDTRLFGKSATGHLFPDVLDDDEKLAVMEYLKTL